MTGGDAIHHTRANVRGTERSGSFLRTLSIASQLRACEVMAGLGWPCLGDGRSPVAGTGTPIATRWVSRVSTSMFVDTLHVVGEIPSTRESFPRLGAFATRIWTVEWILPVTVHTMGLALVTK